MSEGLNSTPAAGPAADATQKRLDEIATRRAEFAAARERRAEELRRQEEVEAAERALRDDEAIERAELEVGPIDRAIALVDTPLGVIIVKRPHAATFKRFQDKESKKSKDVEEFVRACRVHPDLATLEKIFEQLPATGTRCANAAARLAGVRMGEVSEK